MSNLEKNYDPKLIEDKWYTKWEDDGVFHGSSSDGGEPYSIVIPPPNVTGKLHMGHALNNTIQDVLIRWMRMRGKNAVWVPGTDHAGIATQNVVERALKKEGVSRHEIGRDAFIERVWEWKKEYGATIQNQLKRLGASCDWEREAFTMTPELSASVREVFCRLYEKDLIYRGNRIINWCPRCETALSDEESEHEEENGKLYHIRYPMKGGKKKDSIVVATTRPETMLGDVAVAINPRDERYAGLSEKTIMLPLVDRELVVIEDDFVDPEFGTGIVKITPAHDPNDFEAAQRHELKAINVLNADGTMNENAGPTYQGLDRFECRKRIVADLEAGGFLVEIEDHAHKVGHCYRCHAVVEPYLSLQWFVKMKPLARPAIDKVKEGEIRFVPDRWTKTYLNWMENIRDWCISRQIWWGHRIPVFYCDDCDHQWVDRVDPTACASCASSNIRQDEDVLDTWFSSWLWPFTVFGWPEETDDLKFYYPTSTLSTAPEIIFFWVARMIMGGLEFVGEIPFKEVYLHGTVRDELNRKMSKSPKIDQKGKEHHNSIDPIDVIEKYSADSLRFTLVMLTATGQDVQLAVGFDKEGNINEKLRGEFKDFEIGRNFGTKLWNAARFMQMQAPEAPSDFASPDFDASFLSDDDKYLLHNLQRTIRSCDENLQKYRFNDYAKELYDFVRHKYCDWYLEYSKQVFFGDDENRKVVVQKVMHHVFSSALKLLHPVIPFVTEELWHAMGYAVDDATIQLENWPEPVSSECMAAWGVNSKSVDYVESKQDLVRTGRLLKADYNLAAKRTSFIIKPGGDKFADLLEKDVASYISLLKAEAFTIDADYTPSNAVPSAITKLGNLYMPVDGLIDTTAEVARLGKELDKVQSHLAIVSKKLENQKFVANAPKEVVDTQKELKKELLEKCDKLNKLITTLSEE